MSTRRRVSRGSLMALAFLVACSDTPYEPTPARLIGEFSGDAGEGFGTYNLFLAVDQVDDSVHGVWSLSFTATCSSHDGPFSGILGDDRLRLRLLPDEDYEVTLEVMLRILPGDSLLTGLPRLVARGSAPPDVPALCGSDELAAVTLLRGEVNGMPIGR